MERVEDSYKSWCYQHKPEGICDRLELLETCIDMPWRDVVSVTLHDLDKSSFDRRGNIFTVTMKDVPNYEMMRLEAIKVCQLLTTMAADRYVIHHYGQEGEQNDSWVCPNYPWDGQAKCTIRDKYWGEKTTEKFRKLVRAMAEIHEWELIDETIPLLDRFVRAIE